MKRKNPHQHRNQHRKFIFIFVTVLVFVGIGYFGSTYLYSFGTSQTPIAPTSVDKVADGDGSDTSREGTDKTKVDAATLNSYTVAADMPRFLSIKALNMKARIQEMGVNSEGAVQAPINIYDSGWYKGSAKPGTQGAAFIDGHASGATREGLFAYLDTLKAGETVLIERGDGTVLTYRVVNIEVVSIDTVDMRKALAVYGNAKEGLNLMTCTGNWVENKKTYDKRVVVYTERIS